VIRPRSVCVFCGSSLGVRTEYRRSAEDFGRLLAQNQLTLVYGGGRIGLMGAMADACLDAGGQVIGVIPKILYRKEIAHEGLSELRVVETMSERKNVMGELSDAFVALPGGIGTLDELFEVWTWTQLGLQNKISAVLNVSGYFDPLIRFVDLAVEEGFLRPAHREALLVDTDPIALIARILAAEPMTAERNV
jgi:uncharacterized protein (TIGR00730 family)